jgi:hypothetical protein
MRLSLIANQILIAFPVDVVVLRTSTGLDAAAPKEAVGRMPSARELLRMSPWRSSARVAGMPFLFVGKGLYQQKTAKSLLFKPFHAVLRA